MKTAVVIALAALVAGTPLLLSGNQDPILARQESMEQTRDALKPMVGMARGEAPFDATVVMQGLEVMKATAEGYGDLFPAGSETGHDTEARSTIWSDRAGFDEKLGDFAVAVDGAIAAAPQTLDDFKPVLNGVMKTCKGCHDGYRVDKD